MLQSIVWACERMYVRTFIQKGINMFHCCVLLEYSTKPLPLSQKVGFFSFIAHLHAPMDDVSFLSILQEVTKYCTIGQHEVQIDRPTERLSIRIRTACFSLVRSATAPVLYNVAQYRAIDNNNQVMHEIFQEELLRMFGSFFHAWEKNQYLAPKHVAALATTRGGVQGTNDSCHGVLAPSATPARPRRQRLWATRTLPSSQIRGTFFEEGAVGFVM